ncbi:hypothetical protein ACWN8V_11930 [Vagococcus elongatus]|nr:hypothetical protein [Vagococcus elongatus]
MLEIHYFSSKNDTQETIKTYQTSSDFLAAQYLEVPDLQDYFAVSKVLLDGEELKLEDKTILGLFNFLNSSKN